MRDHRPPRLATWLLGLCTPVLQRDFVLGDLEEEFGRRVGEAGVVRAWLWCWLEVARSAWPLITWWGEGRGTMLRGLRQDLRGAARLFVRSPGFAAVVVATLALGIGGATAVYSVVRGIVLVPLPFAEADRVVVLWGETPDYPRAPLTVGDHNALFEGVDAFAMVAASWTNSDLLLGGARAEQVSVGWITPEYFQTVGVSPALGRVPAPGEESAVVLTHALWTRRYGADPTVLGQTIDLGGDSFEVLGVLAEGRSPDLTAFGGGRTSHDVWRLMPAGWTTGDDRSVGWLRSSARLAPGVSVERAQAEVDALMERVNATVTERDGGSELRVHVVPAQLDLVGDVSHTLWILFGAVCGVLLVAAANVAHLLLARGEARGGEVAVRAALGGSRVRLVRQFLMESAGLAAAGGALGLGIAWLGVRALRATAPAGLPRLEAVSLDGGVLAFALLATAATMAVFGLVPALRGSRSDLASAMAGRRSTADPGAQRWSRGLVVAQVALSLALVSGTGLLLRSLAGLERVDLGFERQGVMTAALEAPDWGDNAEAAVRLTDFSDRIATIAGVTAVGFTNRVPLAGGLYTGTVRSDAMAASELDPFDASVRFITPGYLEALGARIVAGRDLAADDGGAVGLLDELAAERLWPGEEAVGRRMEATTVGGDPTWVEVVGIVAPMKHAGVDQPAAETVFLSMLPVAANQNSRYVAVGVRGDAAAILESVQEAVASVDANAVVARPRTMQALFDDSVAATRFASRLLLVFGAVALVLATVGLHGVMAFRMRCRSREMGIRLALGAESRRILRDAFRSGAVLVAAGVALGLVLAMAGGRVLSSLLFDVAPRDTVTLVVSAGVILCAGLVGAYLPARLALRLDPAVTLRQE